MELAELPVPQPKANEAVVKVAASGVNFIDVYFREGRYKAPVPFVLGQEGAGVVSGSRQRRHFGTEAVTAWRGLGCRDRMPNMLPCLPIGWCRFRLALRISRQPPRCCKG